MCNAWTSNSNITPRSAVQENEKIKKEKRMNRNNGKRLRFHFSSGSGLSTFQKAFTATFNPSHPFHASSLPHLKRFQCFGCVFSYSTCPGFSYLTFHLRSYALAQPTTMAPKTNEIFCVVRNVWSPRFVCDKIEFRPDFSAAKTTNK